MCAVNDAIRKQYDEKIRQLNLELDNEENKRNDLDRAKGEVQQLVDKSQCVIDNISQCDFGGDKILSSIKTSQQGYNERIDFYDDYLIKCKNAIDQITKEINETTELRNSLPKNCGVCSECCPPVKENTKGVRK